MFSAIVREYMYPSCMTNPTLRRSVAGGISVKSLPPIVILPEVGAYSPSIRQATVDLPLPVPPTMPSVVPCGTVKLTPFSTGLSASYSNPTPSKTISPESPPSSAP